jgi:hypothetical protein
MIDGVDVLHTVQDDPSDFFERLVRAHRRDGVSLDENVALSQELDCLIETPPSNQLVRSAKKERRGADLECGSVGTDDALASFNEAFLVSHNVANLDNVARVRVLKDLDRLFVYSGSAPNGQRRGEREGNLT